MTKNSSFFTSGMKLADLIHLDYKLLLLLPRFGLNLGFRDQTARNVVPVWGSLPNCLL